MPCCAPGGCPAEAAASEKIRRATLETMQHEKLSEMRNTLNQFHTLPTVDKSKLDDLSISCGPMLDVDNWSVTSPTEYWSKFFMPFDWPQDWLEYLSWSVDWQWVKMDHRDLYSSSHLHFQYHRSRWFQARLCQLYDLDPEVWDVYTESMEMIDAVNLRLPRREFKPKARRGACSYYEYGGQWAFLAKAGSDRSHAACLMLDSGGKDADGLLLRSEVDAAIYMSQFQLRDGHFTDHHTKPILIMTILREQVARLTQAHFDAKQNRLILRQSRLLDLSGKDAGEDAWLLLRWMASTPVGQTKYPEATDPANGHYDEKLSLAPSMIFFHLQKGYKAGNKTTAKSSTTLNIENLAISTPKRAATRPEQVHGTPAAISYQSAGERRNNPASVDEIYANVSLLLLLQGAISESVQFLGNAIWLAPRMSLRLKAPMELMKAQVDGYLCRLKSDEDFETAPLAICETKPFIRSVNSHATLRQETAEMACWIAQHCDSSNGLLQPSLSGRKRRLLISQDRHEIYIIIGEYGTAYEEYITGRTALMACATKPRAGSSFNADENRRAAVGSAAYLRQVERAGMDVNGFQPEASPAPPTSSGILTRAKTAVTRGSPAPPVEVLPSVDEFLVMHQFGPYLTTRADNMRRFVRRVIGLMLQLQDDDVPFTSQPPSEQFLQQQTPRSWPARQATNMEEFEDYSR